MALSRVYTTGSPIVEKNAEIRDYILNRQKAISKKRQACNRPFIKIIPKDGGKQTKLECSVGCFELLRRYLLDTNYNKHIFEKYNLAVEVNHVTEQSGIHPEHVVRAFNRLASGGIGKKHKFTVNMYNTQSSLLINGRNPSFFLEDILPDILELIQKDPNMTNIDQNIANLIDACLQQSARNPAVNTSVVAETSVVNNQMSIKMLLDLQKCNYSDCSDTKTDGSSVCLHCENYVQDEGIRCDDCHKWYHNKCERIDIDLVDFHNDDQPYQCISCRNLVPIRINLFKPHFEHMNSILDPVNEQMTDRTQCIDLTSHGSIVADDEIPLNSKEMSRQRENMPQPVPCIHIESDETTPKTIYQVQTSNTKTSPIDRQINQERIKQNKTKRPTKKDDLIIQDFKQQIEHSTMIIKKLEQKINDLEQTNTLLRKTSVDQQSCRNTESTSTYGNEATRDGKLDSNIEKRLAQLEVNNRIAQLEQNQQMFQIQLQQQQLLSALGQIQHQQLIQATNMSIHLRPPHLQVPMYGNPTNFVQPPFIPSMPNFPRMNLNPTPNRIFHQMNNIPQPPNAATSCNTEYNVQPQKVNKYTYVTEEHKKNENQQRDIHTAAERETQNLTINKNVNGDKDCFIINDTHLTRSRCDRVRFVTGQPLMMTGVKDNTYMTTGDKPRMHSTPKRVSFKENKDRPIQHRVEYQTNNENIQVNVSPKKHFLCQGRATNKIDWVTTERIPSL